MHPENSVSDFVDFLRSSGHEVSAINLATSLEQMASFYRGVRAERVHEDPDGDMLLFQWGVNDWSGTGATFQVNLTRQFIADDGWDDDQISQLSFTLHYAPNGTAKNLESGNHWNSSYLDGLAQWLTTVRNSETFKTFAEIKPLKVELDWFKI